MQDVAFYEVDHRGIARGVQAEGNSEIAPDGEVHAAASVGGRLDDRQRNGVETGATQGGREQIGFPGQVFVAVPMLQGAAAAGGEM